jgi:hypothetical protein
MGWTMRLNLQSSLACIALCAGMAGLPGCGGRSQPSPAATGAPVAQVGRVVVMPASSLPADRVERFQAVDGTSRLTRAIEAALSKAGKFDPASPLVLDVQVTKYRMRSGATVFMAGVMAGGDLLDVDATVREDQRTIRSITTGAGSMGAFVGLDQVSRFEHLTAAVAERVVAQL